MIYVLAYRRVLSFPFFSCHASWMWGVRMNFQITPLILRVKVNTVGSHSNRGKGWGYLYQRTRRSKRVA